VNTGFDLVHDGFIPCVLDDGRVVELGLRSAFKRAGEIREVLDPSPPVTLCLHRLMLAILHRNFGPRDPAAWKQLWEAGNFNMGVLDSYFTRWGDRFDLFSSARPFFQTAGWRAKDPSGCKRLEHALVVGSVARHFHHVADETPRSLTAPQAARLTVVQQAYCMGGGKSETRYTSNGPLVKAALVLVRGRNLFETLLLNMAAYPRAKDDADDDVPCWEREDPSADGDPPLGLLDWLTWQSRQMTLHPEISEGGPVVRSVSLAQKRDPAPGWFDRMAAYIKHKDRGWLPIGLSEHRELWRDSGALFEAIDSDEVGSTKRPDVFNWLARLAREGVIDRHAHFDLSVFGLCSDRVIISFWRHDRIPLPVEYLAEDELVVSLKDSLAAAETVGRELRSAVWRTVSQILAPGEAKADTDRVRGAVSALAPDRLYWSRLEIPFRRFFVELAENASDRVSVAKGWREQTLFRTAREAFRETAGQLDRSARTLRALALGEYGLNGAFDELRQSERRGVMA
jgi:CRISPR system Cascade subunit CasA